MCVHRWQHRWQSSSDSIRLVYKNHYVLQSCSWVLVVCWSLLTSPPRICSGGFLIFHEREFLSRRFLMVQHLCITVLNQKVLTSLITQAVTVFKNIVTKHFEWETALHELTRNDNAIFCIHSWCIFHNLSCARIRMHDSKVLIFVLPLRSFIHGHESIDA